MAKLEIALGVTEVNRRTTGRESGKETDGTSRHPDMDTSSTGSECEMKEKQREKKEEGQGKGGRKGRANRQVN